MYDAELPSHAAGGPPADLDTAVARASAGLLRWQKPDGHWVFELEADATIPAEHLLLRRYLGEPHDPELERRTANYLRRIQGSHGGWPLFHDGAFDVSATVKAYFALRFAGDAADAPHMVRAREAVLAHGGAAAVNVFSRLQLALFGIAPPGRRPWSDIPTMPPELILAPRWFPVHLMKMSYWARTVIVPLLVLGALKPTARDTSVRLDELYLPRDAPLPPRKTHQHPFWRVAFGSLDVVLKAVEPLWPRRLRARAIERCRAFVVERLNGEDGLGAIYPAMANSVMMFDALGYAADHPDRAIARRSVAKLVVEAPEDGHPDEIYCQPCMSPVWDTALAAHALMEAGDPAGEAAALRGLAWLKPLQVLDVRGDWAEVKPDVRPGGWAFQYRNDHYPDLDDTAVVVLAMDRARRLGASGYDEAIARGEEWTVGLQSKDGGFGAFDADNVHHYLNNIPFADHGALLDPPTEDVTGRVVCMMAQLGEPADSPRMRAACRYLEETQKPDGSWFGRWGVNYVYGTWSVMCALNAAGYAGDHPVMRRGADWLRAIQNADGGWGEDCESYSLDYTAYAPHASTASQTAWALLALMAAGRADDPAVARGVAWLLERQGEDGLWPQEHYTGGGFPRVFYLRYHGYPKFFPLWAVARYRNLRRANSREVGWGM